MKKLHVAKVLPYEQLEDKVFKCWRITPRNYIEHLQLEWVKLYKPAVEKETNNYKRGWLEDKHITLFGRRRDLE